MTFLSIKLITIDEQDQMAITQNSTVVLAAPDQSVVPASESRLDTQEQEIVQLSIFEAASAAVIMCWQSLQS